MQQGKSSVLLVEEFIEQLNKSGDLFALALAAQDYSRSLESMSALAWYLYHLQRFRDFLSMSAAALEDGRTAEQFLNFGKDIDTPDRDVPLEELEAAHDKFRQDFNTLTLSYHNHIIRNRPLKLLVNSADSHWTLMTANLNQAIKMK